MSYWRILLLLILVAKWTVVGAEIPGVEAFTAPGRLWQSVPPGWSQQPITPEVDAQDADLAITLDQQLYPYLLPIIEAYSQKHGLQIAVSSGTCGISAGALLRKTVDVGGFCCPAGPMDRLPGLRFHTLAVAAIALLVHPDNRVEDLTLSQARGIFQGEIADWSSVVDTKGSGPTRAIRPITRFHCPHRPGHWRLLLDSEELFSLNVSEVGAIEDMVRVVAADPQAIGYETLWMTRRYQAMGEVKPLRLNGIRPDDADALAQGRYPLYRVYNVTSWEGVAGKALARDLVSHLFDSTQALVNNSYMMVPASRLRAHGWRFEGDELIGEPESIASRGSLGQIKESVLLPGIPHAPFPNPATILGQVRR